MKKMKLIILSIILLILFGTPTQVLAIDLPFVPADPEPSIAPTAAPSEAPTAKPTEVPTTAPSEAPTAKPTEVPTTEPSEAPTAKPTEVPTTAPTRKPNSDSTPALPFEPIIEPTPTPDLTSTPDPTNTSTPTSDSVNTPEPTKIPLPAQETDEQSPQGDKTKNTVTIVGKATDKNLSADLINQIKGAGKGKNVRITYIIDKKRKLIIDTCNLTAGKKLKLYKWKNNRYYMIKQTASTYRLNKDGSLPLSAIRSGMKGTFIFISDKEAKKVNRQIKSKTKLKAPSRKLKIGKNLSISFASGTEIPNISKTTYASSSKKIAGVTSKGKVTGKSIGNALVKVTVHFKNGDKKVVKMKVLVRH